MGLLAGVGDFGLQELLDETIQARDQALAAAQNYEDKGPYNAAANTPHLTGDATVGQISQRPQRYVVTVSGAVAFSGFNFASGDLLRIGDQLYQHYTGQWYLELRSDVALEKILAIDPLVPGIPSFIDAFSNEKLPIVMGENFKMILSYSANGKTYGIFDLSESTVTKSSLEDEIVQGLVSTYDPDLLPDNARYPILTNPDGSKMIISHSKEGKVYGVFDLSDSNIPVESLPQDVQNSILSTYDPDLLGDNAKFPIVTSADGTKTLLYHTAKGVIGGRFDLSNSIFGNEDQWKGKLIVWTGTSIPWSYAPNSYPEQVAAKLGATVQNNSISGSPIIFRAKNGSDPGSNGMGATYQQLINAGMSQNYSFENRIVPYLNTADLIVIDHGPNDMASVAAGKLGTIDSYDNTTLYGAYNYIISECLKINPNTRFLITTLINRYQVGGVAETFFLQVCDAQRKVADRWNAYLLDYALLCGVTPYTVVAGRLTTDGLHPNEPFIGTIADISTKFFIESIKI